MRRASTLGLALPLLLACSHPPPTVADQESPQCRMVADQALAALGEVLPSDDPWKEIANDPAKVTQALDALGSYPIPDRTATSVFDRALKNGGIADADVPKFFEAKGCSVIRFFRAWKITLASLKHYKISGAEKERARARLAHYLQTMPEAPSLIEVLVRIQLAEWGVESGLFRPSKPTVKKLADLRTRATNDKNKIRLAWKKLEALERPEDYETWTDAEKTLVKQTLFDELSTVQSLADELSGTARDLARNPA